MGLKTISSCEIMCDGNSNRDNLISTNINFVSDITDNSNRGKNVLEIIKGTKPILEHYETQRFCAKHK